MTTVTQTDFARNWQDIAANRLKLGATAYGGPAIMGIMQAELRAVKGVLCTFTHALGTASRAPS